MKKAAAIALVAAALAVAVPFVFAGPRTEAIAVPEYNIVANVRMADASVVVPAYTRGPRIIQVPQPSERNARASIGDRDNLDISNYEDDYERTPPRRQAVPPLRTVPRWAPKREAVVPPKPRHIETTKLHGNDASASLPPISQPLGPRRTMLSAPPPAAEGPTPIRRTPKFGAKAEAGEKFTAPRPPVTEDAPPPGYTPPAAAPHIEESDSAAAQ